MKNTLGDGNIDGTPTVSINEILIILGYKNPDWQTPSNTFSFAPTGAIPPIIIDKARCDNIISNIANKRTAIDFDMLRPARIATPRIMLSGSNRSASTDIRNIGPVMNSLIFSKSVVGIRPI